MIKQKSVLYVSPLPPPAGGIASWTKRIKEMGLPKGYEARFLNTRKYKVKIISRLLTEIYRTSSIIFRLFFSLALRRPDIVHLNTSLEDFGIYRDWICATLVRIFNVPLVIHYRCEVPDRLNGKSVYKRYAAKRLCHTAVVNLVLTRDSERYLASEYERRSTRIANFIEDEKVTKVKQWQKTSEKPIALFVGYICKNKGCDLVLQCATCFPSVQFVFIGKCFEEMKPLLKNPPENVKLIGEIPIQELAAYYQQADFFIFPTLSEGFPNALLEAMANGLPVISTRVGAIPDMIDDGSGGILIDAGSLEQLCTTIKTFLSNRDTLKLMGQHNKEKVLNNFTYSIIIEMLVRIYDNITEQHVDLSKSAT